MGNVIFLDASSSAYFMAEPLSSLKDITVITNSIDTLYLLSQYNIKTYSTGGLISSENRSCLAGPSAVRTVREFQADFLFFSAQAISSNGIISDCYEQEVFLRQAMMQNAGQTVFLCDESKLGQRSIFKLCDISNVDTIICNTALDGYFERTYPSLNILQT